MEMHYIGNICAISFLIEVRPDSTPALVCAIGGELGVKERRGWGPGRDLHCASVDWFPSFEEVALRKVHGFPGKPFLSGPRAQWFPSQLNK